MYKIYVLKSERDNNWYIGCTSNLDKRLLSHNVGQVRSTKSRRPFKLIYEESFDDKYEAFRTERLYKSAAGKRLLKEKMKHCQIV